jgi:hypothetical protein
LKHDAAGHIHGVCGGGLEGEERGQDALEAGGVVID